MTDIKNESEQSGSALHGQRTHLHLSKIIRVTTRNSFGDSGGIAEEESVHSAGSESAQCRRASSSPGFSHGFPEGQG